MWVKLGDEFIDDAADLSDAAFRTHIEGIAWSARRMLDLHIPKKDLVRFVFSPQAGAAIDELIKAAWWIDNGDTWFIAYHPEWQFTKDRIEQRRYANAQSQERGRRHRSGDHSMCLPGKCSPLSAADSAHDKGADRDADPARLGSVRELPTTAPIESTHQKPYCRECERLSPLGVQCAEHLEAS